MQDVTAGAGVSTSIDAREARLRVLAASTATIIAGWTLYAAGHLGGGGWRLIVWIAGFFWSALWCASSVARVVGRRNGRRYWALSASYACYLPLITWLSAGAGGKQLIDLDGGSLVLVVASMAVLLALGIAGFLLERPSLPVQQRPSR
jgi:hypothetical protein